MDDRALLPTLHGRVTNPTGDRHFFRLDVQFSTTVNGTDALGPAGVTSRNRLPSAAHVDGKRSRRRLKERRRRPGLEPRAGGHVDGHQFPARREIKELAAITTPAWCAATAAGHQHTFSRAG